MYKVTSKRLGDSYFQKVINGVRVYVYPVLGRFSTAINLSINIGFSVLDFKLNDNRISVRPGTAHFLEHIMFEDIKGGNSDDKFISIGSSSNAFTSDNKTVYTASATEDVIGTIELLIDLVLNPSFSEDSVEKEKSIIIEEIKMYLDDIEWTLISSSLSQMYFNHPIKFDIIGNIDSVKKLEAKDLKRLFDAFYRPENISITVAGDINPAKVFEICENKLNFENFNSSVCETIPVFEPDIVKLPYSLGNMPVSNPYFCLGFKEAPIENDPKIKLRRLISNSLLMETIAGETSKLNMRLYDSGIIDSELDYYSINGNGYFCNFLFAGSNNCEAAISEIVSEIEALKETGICNKRFEENKRSLLGSALSSFDSISSISSGLAESCFEGYDFFDPIEQIEEIDLDEVSMELCKTLRNNKKAITIIYPH
ncbi:MAG: insulinase family protein [Ruminococcaceae bacterium]|nr:insulinase family protein [Oscillospiraceae bacterium]